MDLLKTVKRRTFWSEIVYHSLNLGLAAVLLAIARTIQSPYPALALVILSKWRVIAVRPRFWWANIQANLVDVAVGVGIVGLMYLPNIGFTIQTVLAVLYAIWLIVIKPLSKRWQIALQAGCAILVGTISLMAVSYDWPVSAVVFLMFLLGYGAARHFLHSYDEEQTTLLSFVWGLVFAELGWLAYYWNFSYLRTLAGGIPQITIILLLISFCGGKVYQSWKKHKKIIFSEIVGPVFLAVATTLVMLLAFNSVVI